MYQNNLKKASNYLQYNRIVSIKRQNRNRNFEYYHLANQNKHKKQALITFTYKDSDKYFQLDIINKIRNTFNKHIKNLNNSEIKYFSNIELGKNMDNPHLHVNIWFDNQEQINRVYNAVVEEYGLFIDYCKVSVSNIKNAVYGYVVKDYDNSKSDEYLLLLDDVKKDFRSKLCCNVRFSSHSKSKYNKSVYKKAFSIGIKKINVDYLIDNCFMNKDCEFIYSRVIELKVVLLSFLVPLITRELIKYEYLKINTEYHQIINAWRVYQYF